MAVRKPPAQAADRRSFLPASADEVKALGWDSLDVILLSGDAYIDHPAFGAAVIGRTLQAAGYRVAVVPQPNWRDDLRDFRKLGAPRLFFGVTAGSMDSMVNHYTAARRRRSDDAYTPGGRPGARPDRAVTVYTRILKSLWPHVPVVIGGIEASLRRLTHYDYWDDRLMPSVLLDSGADLLVYGMGERPILETAKALHNGFNAKLLRGIRQVAFMADEKYADRLGSEAVRLHSYEKCVADGDAFAENFVIVETESNRLRQEKILVEPAGGGFVIVNPPYPPETPEELDRIYALPYTRLPHPRYRDKGSIPAWDMIKHSITLHRGCFGGCSFCTISAHQGKFVRSRSPESVIAEAERITNMPGFRGVISDMGGPSANMYGLGGRDAASCDRCLRPSCLFPRRCPNLRTEHAPLLDLYKKVNGLKGIRKVFIGSGIRYDLFDGADGMRYLKEVVAEHTSGWFKVAPEHTEDDVLRLMRKPPFALFEKLAADFKSICREEGLPYRIVPYFISSHPGCTAAHMKELSRRTSSLGLKLEQVQDLTPTPMTLSSVMFHTGKDPYTKKQVYVARGAEEKRMQKSYFFRGASPAKHGGN